MIPSSTTANNTDSISAFHSHVYPSEFEKNYMIGNVGMLDVAVNTWFGNDPLYVHMINAIPITAATRLLFEKEYVKHEYPFLMNRRDGVEMAWRGYTVSIHSIIDPNKAWEEAHLLVSSQLDAALSKSQVMYFISQQPGFNVSLDTTNKKGDINTTDESSTSFQGSDSNNELKASSSSCEKNPNSSRKSQVAM